MAIDSANYPVYARMSLAGQRYCFVRYTPQNRVMIADPTNELICGTLEHAGDDVSPGLRLYGFEVVLMPTPEELIELMPLCGFSEDGSYYSILANGTNPTFTAQFDSNVQVETYQNCVVSRVVFSCQTGGPLMMTIQAIAKTMVTNVSYTGTAVSPNSRPWFMSYATATLDGDEVAFRQFTYALDWKVQRAINNSEVAGDLDPTDIQQYVVLNMPFNDTRLAKLTEALGADRADGMPGVVTFNRTLDSAQYTVFNFSNLKRPEANTPAWLGKQVEIRDAAVFRVFADPAPSTIVTVSNGAITSTTTSTTTTAAP